MNRDRLRSLLLLTAATFAAPAAAQQTGPSYIQEPGGFVSAKGERALVMGYPRALEVWAYPLQLVSDYSVRFREPGRIEPIDAMPLLRRVERTPTEVIRTFIGPDFAVKEHLFVPHLQAGAIIRYEVAGRAGIQIEASFKPSLNLMWPAALGGQSIGWNAARSGYVESEPLHHFSATIASPQAIAHDDTINRNRALSDRLTMLLQPAPDAEGERSATLAFALNPQGGGDGAAALIVGAAQARIEAETHANAVLASSLDIETPDPEVNDALRSATLALDQAWACNTLLGCGELAGFGPSRPGRRPQYAWFFAGDGLIAMQAMLDAGQFSRARDELAFVTRYQDPRTGMIWHELSQSAGLIDWVGRYPYMYVHVDISFQYLAAVARYLAATGDTAFVRKNWRAIDRAWAYCLSVIDAKSGLPRIPAGKEGQDEQHRLRDDMRLSSSWVGAADGFATIAAAVGRPALAADARAAAQRARRQIAAGDWDAAQHFWLSGHTMSGAPVVSEGSGAIGIIDQHVFDPAQNDQILDRLASPDFVADWGLRGLSASDPAYDPNAYSSGAVSALGTSDAATVFWHQHRPWIAWQLWRGVVAWNRLDSAGHIHELAAGDLFHPEIESVPEQTWSSAGLLSTAVEGLLGLEVNAASRSLRFAPNLPDAWHALTLRNLRVADTRLTVTLRKEPDGMTMTVDNPGPAVAFAFDPMLPPGAERAAATLNGEPHATTAEPHPLDTHSLVEFAAATGRSVVHLAYRGAIAMTPMMPDPVPGNPSMNPILEERPVASDRLAINGWVSTRQPAVIAIETCRPLSLVSGAAQLLPIGEGRYSLTMSAPHTRPTTAGGYVPVSVVLDMGASAFRRGRSTWRASSSSAQSGAVPSTTGATPSRGCAR